MKILIAYYSSGGSTKKVADRLEKRFVEGGHEVDVERIRAKEERSVLGWWLMRFFRRSCDIEQIQIKNVSKYDLICIGSPNWTGLSLPTMRYIQDVEGLEHKKVGLFATTAAWPSLEWYFFSTYLLDLMFSSAIEKKMGRIAGSMLLSSRVKRSSVFSVYGEKMIERFYKDVTASEVSFKEYVVERRRIDEARSVVNLFFVVLFLLLTYQLLSSISSLDALPQNSFTAIFLTLVIPYIIILITLQKRRFLGLSKHLVGAAMGLLWTIVAYSFIDLPTNFIMLGFVLIMVFLSLFRSLGTIFVVGTTSLIGYVFLLFNHQNMLAFNPRLDLPLLYIGISLVSFVTQRLSTSYSGLLEAQGKVEDERSVLEVRVKERTRELQDLTETLDRQVEDKTKELENRIRELEKFKRLTVGRELKMIELKKELENLKKN